jgi:phage-related protein (TIGR01555 family)
MTRAKRPINIERTAAATNDGLTNLVARLGVNGTNALSGGGYRTSGLTNSQQKLDVMYQSSWIVGKVVDAVAEDMTRAGISITGVDDQADEVQAEMTRTGVWPQLTTLIKWARLYGGAIGVMIIEGQNLASPLRIDTVMQGSFRGIKVLDRWRVQPLGNATIVLDDTPEYYVFSATGEKIHHTRVIRQIGVELPFWASIEQQGWGASVIERMDDRILSFDSVTMGVANLVFKAHLRTMRIENYRGILAGGGKAEENLLKSLKLMQVLQTNEGLTVMDKLDEFATHSYSFAGLSDTVLQFAQQLAGASGIPLVRLFGQSPAGLNATGDGDIRNYYDTVANQQEARLRGPMEQLMQVVYRSAMGSAPPDEMAIGFVPLWQMSAKEKADIGKVLTEAITSLAGSDIISKGTALREMQRVGLETGLGSTITDEEVDEADEEPPLPTAPEGATLPGDPDAPSADGAEPVAKPTADGWRKYFRRRS